MTAIIPVVLGAVILVAGDKSGVAQSRFYKGLIAKADRRIGQHLKTTTER